jgi:hypothetical protein
MALNLAHYDKIYNGKFKEAFKKSGEFINVLQTGRPPDMPLEFITAITTKNIDSPKEYYDGVCRIIESIMFSSGYWTSYKIRKQKDGMLRVRYEISMMTEAEKQDHLWDEYEGLGDPATWGESDSDGYTSDDDDEPPKSEIATV